MAPKVIVRKPPKPNPPNPGSTDPGPVHLRPGSPSNSDGPAAKIPRPALPDKTADAETGGDSSRQTTPPPPAIIISDLPVAVETRLHSDVMQVLNYRFLPPNSLPPADGHGIRTFLGRQFVDLAEGWVVQVRRDTVTGAYRATQASELGASGPPLFLDRVTMTWRPAEPDPSSGDGHKIDIDVDLLVQTVRNGSMEDPEISAGRTDTIESFLPAGAVVFARGLRQFPAEQAAVTYSELKAAELMFSEAKQAVDLNYIEAKVVIESYFGSRHEVATDRFYDSLSRGASLANEYQGEWGVDKFMCVDLDVYHQALVHKNDARGRIFIILENIKEGFHTVLGHEMLHVSRVSGFDSVSPGAVDYFYLRPEVLHTLKVPTSAHDIPERGVSEIIMQGGLTVEYLQITRIYEAQFINAVSEYSGVPNVFNIQTAVDFFNANPVIRAEMASRNNDSIVFAAKSMQQLHQARVADSQLFNSLINA